MKKRNLLGLVVVECILIFIILGITYYFGGSAKAPPKAAGRLPASRPVPDRPILYKKPLAKSMPTKEYKPTFGACIYLAGRAHSILYKILRSNTELARDRQRGLKYGIGIHTMTGTHFPEYLKSVFGNFNIGDGLTIVNVVKDSPAEKAGLKIYDRLVAVDGYPIWEKPILTPAKFKNARDKFDLMVDKTSDHFGSVNLTVLRRDGVEHTFNVVPEVICNAKFNMIIDNEFRAFAEPLRNITMTTEAIDFIEDDSQLAMVLGHELGHITRLHIGKKVVGAIAGKLAGKAIGQAIEVDIPTVTSRLGKTVGKMVFSHKYELEADYFGLYHAARAGYDVSKAPDFWKQLAATEKTSKAVGFEEKISKLKGKLSHPPHIKRFKKLHVTSNEIYSKKAKGEPIVPNIKRFTKK